MIIAIVAAVAVIVVNFVRDNILVISESKGLGLPSAGSWVDSGMLSLAINIVLMTAAAMLMILLNKRYNIIRSISSLYATMFIVMQASLPGLAGRFHDGTLLCVTTLFATFILFSTYGRHNETRSIFMVFFLLATGALTQYAYAFLIPIFLLGCVQMRTLTFRGLLAAGIGIFTPVWILWGFDVIRPDEIELPDFTSVFLALEHDDAIRILATVGFTALITIVAGVANFMKIYSYNSRARAFNGFFGILAITTIILLSVDFTNITVYISLLDCCAAFQVGHFFVINSHKRTYIPIIALFLIYSAFSLWFLIG